MMFCLERNLLHLCLPTLRADKLMLIHEHKGHMIADTNMAQLNMVGVMNFHPASAVLACKVSSVKEQIAMKAVGISAGAGRLFRCSVINEINKIVGEQKHVWKIST